MDRATLEMNAPVLAVEQEVEQYGIYVTECIPDDYNVDVDALLALMLRDSLEHRWGELSPAQHQQVQQFDRQLVVQHERVAFALPHPTKSIDGQWWWRLHEGPQVAPPELRP
jgi:hypothetical protein